MAFADIAKMVGERWKVLAQEKREIYEYEASAAKDKFNSEFEEYKKTDNYREYHKYLADFKTKLGLKEGKELTCEFILIFGGAALIDLYRSTRVRQQTAKAGHQPCIRATGSRGDSP